MQLEIVIIDPAKPGASFSPPSSTYLQRDRSPFLIIHLLADQVYIFDPRRQYKKLLNNVSLIILCS